MNDVIKIACGVCLGLLMFILVAAALGLVLSEVLYNLMLNAF